MEVRDVVGTGLEIRAYLEWRAWRVSLVYRERVAVNQVVRLVLVLVLPLDRARD